jgi:hypothetical protein
VRIENKNSSSKSGRFGLTTIHHVSLVWGPCFRPTVTNAYCRPRLAIGSESLKSSELGQNAFDQEKGSNQEKGLQCLKPQTIWRTEIMHRARAEAFDSGWGQGCVTSVTPLGSRRTRHTTPKCTNQMDAFRKAIKCTIETDASRHTANRTYVCLPFPFGTWKVRALRLACITPARKVKAACHTLVPSFVKSRERFSQ